MNTKKRYFLVFYVVDNNHHFCKTWTTDDGKYISLLSFLCDLAKMDSLESYSITNIIELSESDYNDFYN